MRDNAYHDDFLGQRVRSGSAEVFFSCSDVHLVVRHPNASDKFRRFFERLRNRLLHEVQADFRLVSFLFTCRVVMHLDNEIRAFLQISSHTIRQRSRRVTDRPTAQRTGWQEPRATEVRVTRFWRSLIEFSGRSTGIKE